jgi:hypothetical protein
MSHTDQAVKQTYVSFTRGKHLAFWGLHQTVVINIYKCLHTCVYCSLKHAICPRIYPGMVSCDFISSSLRKVRLIGSFSHKFTYTYKHTHLHTHADSAFQVQARLEASFQRLDKALTHASKRLPKSTIKVTLKAPTCPPSRYTPVCVCG